MSDYVSLTCPSCGGKLQVSTTIDRFACAYCGNEHIVKRGDGIIFLQPVVEGLQKVQSGVDKTASELAIKRLMEEIVALKAEREEEVNTFKGNKYGMVFVTIFMCASFTFFCFLFFLDSQPIVPTIFLAFSIVVVLNILMYVNKKKKEEEKRWMKFDVLISLKKKELLYHQDIVSKY